MKSINVIRRPRQRSKLTHAKIKEYLEVFVVSKPVRIQTIERYAIHDNIRGKTIEGVFVIYDRLMDRSWDGELMSYCEIRWQVWEDGKPQAGGIFG